MIRLLTTLIRDPDLREHYREQWAADLGLSRSNVLLGAATTCVRLRFATRKAHAMLPIGPLAIALRHFGNRGQALVVTAVSLFLLLGGVVLLIR